MEIITVGKNDDGRRVDAFLAHLMPDAPKSLIYKYIRTNKIKLGGKKPKPDARVHEGDEIRYFGDEALLVRKAVPLAGLAENRLPAVLYEDEHIILLYKPAGVASQPDGGHKTGTLADQLKWYLYKSGAYRPEEENGFSPALCNRLDFNTRGIVIGAKTLPALREMNRMIRERRVRKFYLCRTDGVPEKPEGTISAALYKDKDKNISRISEKGKAAATRYRVLESEGGKSLIEAELLSGRSHQIRVHLKSIGCPLIGDAKYGTGGTGQALFAYKVIFDFPPGGVLADVAGKTFTAEEL